MAGGADVVAWDDNAAAREAAARRRASRPPTSHEADWTAFAALVLAPGVPLTHPEPHWTVTRAKRPASRSSATSSCSAASGARIAPDAPLRRHHRHQRQVDDDGADRAHPRAAGRDVQMGGNIGTAMLSLEPPAPGRIHVIEMSSFQIDLAPTPRSRASACCST